MKKEDKIEPLRIMYAYRQPELALKINEIIEKLNKLIELQEKEDIKE